MNILSTIYHDDKTKTCIFAETPKMSTYLLAFAIGKFDFIEAKTLGGIVTRAYSDVGSSDVMEFALDTDAVFLVGHIFCTG